MITLHISPDTGVLLAAMWVTAWAVILGVFGLVGWLTACGRGVKQ